MRPRFLFGNREHDMTSRHTEPTAPAATQQVSGAAQSTFKKHLLAGVATLALLASGSAYTMHAYSADLLGASPFGANAAAQTPASPIVMPGFNDLVTAVKPAVVSVRVKANATQMANSDEDSPNPLEGSPFEKFFKEFRDQNGQRMMPGGRQPHQFVQGQGSGFFISANGYIVTNNHVVDHSVKVEVLTDSGATFEAKVIGTDPKSDLALIKVDGHTDFPFVRLADTMPKIGEWVVAMGNPFGLGGTVTAGIVSAQGRDIGSGPYDDYIQIDAPVNRGNSGGPTFNLKGEVIGVNTAIYSPSGGSVGIAFDIPASTVASVIPQLQKNGRVARGWLGVQIQPVTAEIADSLGLKTATGALVSEPQADSPAAKAGLRSGDVITKVDTAEIKNPRELARMIANLGPNKSVALSIIRDGKPQTIDLKLGQLNDQKVHKASATEQSGPQLGSLGLTVAPAAEVDGAGDRGLAIVGVDPNGKAAELGFQQGDVILKAGNKSVSSPGDLTTAMSEAKAAGHKNTLIMLKRDQSNRYVAVPSDVS
jgi:serine protease Do